MLVPAEIIQKQNRFSFLQSGGEMGELTRNHNWAETELGPPENWPNSLCTTLGILLHSAFPMFLFWGKNLISFYNDAFRPSLGIDGKHPSIGKKGKDVWPEIWDYIGPMIHQIMETGKPVWFEDQLVPFYRNGRMEDIYWTFCYSPVFGDDGKISGVFVTCTETTEKVVSLKKLEEANTQFQKMLMQAPVAIAVFRGENFIAEMANDAYLPLVGKTREAFVGKPLFETLPETREILEPLALELVRTGQPLPATEFEMVINRNGIDETCYFNSLWEPVFDKQGKVDGFMVVAHEVTEQVKTRKIIEASDAQMKSFFNQAPAAIAVLKGPELLFTLANPLYQKLFGRTEEQLLGKSINEVWPGNEGKEIWEIFHTVYSTGKPLFAHDFTANFQEDGVSKTGYFDFIAHPIQDNDGKVSNIMIHATEITGQVNARRKLEESEQQVRSLVESAPFPIGVYIGKEMRIALANQSIIDVFGKGNDVIGKLYSEILPELGNQEIFSQLDQVFTTGIPFHAKYQQVDIVVDGKLQPYYFNYSFTPLFDAEGKVYGVMNTAAEVTDLVMAKQKVEESEQKYRSLVMEAPVGICIVTEDGIRVETVNDSFLEVIRKSRADFEGKLYWEAIPEAEEFYAPILKKAFETGTPFRGQEHELTLMRKGKEETLYVNFVYNPIREEDGSVRRVMILVIEVTPQVIARRKIEEVIAERTRELAQANESLIRSNEELARSNTNLEEFAYAASHDMKEPIRKIHFFSDRIKASLADKFPAEELRYFSRMEEASRRMTSLIDDLISYSQVSLRPKSLEEINLNRLIEIVLTDLDLEIEQKKAKIHVGRLCSIPGHQRQLQQAFQNLLANSLKYSQANLVPEITIESKMVHGHETGLHLSADEQQKEFCMITIRDNGIGFDQEDAERIFNVFTRLHGNAEYRGTGVGLSIVRKVIENHQGYVKAEGQQGKGAKFMVYLPVGGKE